MSENNVQNISFSGAFITGKAVTEVRDYFVEGRTIVVNPTLERVEIDATPKKYIEPKSSVILENIAVVQAELLLLLQVKERRNLGNIVFEAGWSLYGDPPTFQLWKSPQDEVGTLNFDPRLFNGETTTGEKENFKVKVNLWFSPEKTDCMIHNQHTFIEIHTQVVGTGHMQKFTQNDFSALYFDELMAEGYTTPHPYCVCTDAGEPRFEYPWHQYYADSDCIWMAIEFHPEGG